MDDCPECGRLNAIEERIKRAVYLVPPPQGDGVKQLKDDAAWMAAQLRERNLWAKRVVDLHDHITAIENAALPMTRIGAISNLRKAYEALFHQPKDAA